MSVLPGQRADVAGRGDVAYVHAGTHKTGSTSFQTWAYEQRSELARATGLEYYDGVFGANHYEFSLLCLRHNCGMTMRSRFPDWCLDEWRVQAESHIRDQVKRPGPLLISAEALSYFRQAEEVDCLQRLLAPRSIIAVIVLREPSAFLDSYRRTLSAHDVSPSSFRESFAYVERDSWLADYDRLLMPYQARLGSESTITLNYEDALSEHGSIIPAIIEAIGYDAAIIPSWEKDELSPVKQPRPRVKQPRPRRLQSARSRFRR